jgi:cytochrome c-type biogenesis protein
VIEILFEVSGKIAASIQGLSEGGSASVAALALIALGGLLAGISPSGLTGALAVLGQLSPLDNPSRSNQNRGIVIALAFSLGMMIALAALGLVAAWGGRILLGLSLTRWLPLLTLVMGLHLLGVIRWKGLRLTSGPGDAASGPMNAFWLGLPFGLATAPCVLPVLVTVLVVAAAEGSMSFGLVGLGAFALGRSVPVLLLGLFSDQVMAVPRIQRIAPYLRKSSGALIAIVSLYFLTLGRDLLA